MILSVGQAGTESLSIDNLKIPLEDKGSLLIPFHGPRGTYRHISASDILKGITGTEEIEGHIVIIGVIAPGLLDIHATPIDPAMAGVEVHANIIDAILQGDFLVRPKAAAVYELIAIVFFGLLSTILFARCRAVANLTFLFLFALGSVVLTAFLFRKGIYLSPLFPVLAYASNFSLLSFLDFWHEERLLKEKTRLQLATQEAMLETIANITETRDPQTGGHIRRTRSYVEALARHISSKPAFTDIVNDDYIENLICSAPLHDLGKVGVPDYILLKHGLLTADEFDEMKKHAHYGKRVIDAAQTKLGDISFLRLAGDMAFSHHEPLAAEAPRMVKYCIERRGMIVNSDYMPPSGKTLVYVMIGHPVTQVKSPTTFNKYFREKQMDRVMIAIDVQPDFVGPFFSLLRGWRNCPGCVVTIPYKQDAAHCVDELSDRARDLEAVNVIRRTEKGQLIGDMVDGLGFLEALRSNGFEVSSKRVAVFGAGGAGGAIAYAVAQARAAELVVIDTDIGRRERLLDLLALRFPSVSLSQHLDSLAGVDLAVNATPLGMNDDTRIPFPLDSLSSRTFVADVVTEPDITPWLSAAKARGCSIQTGYEMTLGQFTLMGRHMGIEFGKENLITPLVYLPPPRHPSVSIVMAGHSSLLFPMNRWLPGFRPLFLSYPLPQGT